MKPVECVAIPGRMQHLPRDKRGYPIPVIVYRDETGRPHFTINSDTDRAAVIAGDCCSICGNRLFRGRWYVGGYMSAFHPNGAYIDPAMHSECVHYALQVCPYIAMPGYSKRIDAATLAHKTQKLLVDYTSIPDQPEVFVAVMCIGAERIERPGNTDVFRPKRPFRQIEYWRGGVQITENEAIPLMSVDRTVSGTLLPKAYVPSSSR